MSIASSLLTLAEIIDPTQSYWTILMTSGKIWSEHSLVATWNKGQRGVRLLDWGNDIVTTGDVYRVKEIRLHCPNGAPDAVLEIGPGQEPFQFKAKSMDFLGSYANQLEFQVIGRIVDKSTGACECFIWDYRPEQGQPNLIAYRSRISEFGSWRSTITPIGSIDPNAQGFRS